MPRLMTSLPEAANAVARASTAKAFSSPMRSKAEIVWSMSVIPSRCRTDVGEVKVVPCEEQGQVAMLGNGIGQTVPEIQLGRMSRSLAVDRCRVRGNRGVLWFDR